MKKLIKLSAILLAAILIFSCDLIQKELEKEQEPSTPTDEVVVDDPTVTPGEETPATPGEEGGEEGTPSEPGEEGEPVVPGEEGEPTVPGEEGGEEGELEPPVHTHEYEATAQSDETHHWFLTTCDHNGEEEAVVKEKHKMKWFGSSSGSEPYGRCEVCGFEKREANYLRFTAVGGSVEIGFNDLNQWYYLWKKTSEDEEFYPWYVGSEFITLNDGDYVDIYGLLDNEDYFGEQDASIGQFSMSGEGQVIASGSVTSLLDGKGIDSDYPLFELVFEQLFEGCDLLIEAPELPSSTLAPACYQGMFNLCTSLTVAPDLPATTLAYSCYAMMFADSGVRVPAALPATELEADCYSMMYSFSENLELTTASEGVAWSLPAEVAEQDGYQGMFEDSSVFGDVGGTPTPGVIYYFKK